MGRGFLETACPQAVSRFKLST